MKYTFVLLLSIFFSKTLFSQENSSIKEKYIIVSSTFDFLKQVDRYKTSSFTKFLFNKAGFKVYLDNEELPKELYYNKCSAIYVNVKDNSNLFATKNFIELLDCNGSVFYTSKVGASKLKDYERCYRETIREAFSSIENLNAIHTSFLVTKAEYTNKEEMSKDLIDSSEIKEDSSIQLVIEDSITEDVKKSNYPLLNAQKTKTGYLLINLKQELVFILLNTGNENRFIIKNKNGSLINKGNYWLAEYYKGQKLITKTIQIKF
tara:strand:- start:783 stop:1568 length:786 start_codon:yes stop_codon:yes gene_type:complete